MDSMSRTGNRLLDPSRPSLDPAVEVIPEPAGDSPEPAAGPITTEKVPSRAARVVVEIILTLGALLGLAVIVITLTATHTGIRPLVVRSGSMEPTIPTGSMVLVQRIDAAEIEVGDVVAVGRPDHTRVTHRVIALERKGVTVELTLKGDANEDPDPVPVTVRQADRLVAQAPLLGQTVAWLATAPGGFVMGCLATAGGLQVLGRRSTGGARRRRPGRRARAGPDASAQ